MTITYTAPHNSAPAQTTVETAERLRAFHEYLGALSIKEYASLPLAEHEQRFTTGQVTEHQVAPVSDLEPPKTA